MLHSVGNEEKWWKDLGIDPTVHAKSLWRRAALPRLRAFADAGPPSTVCPTSGHRTEGERRRSLPPYSPDFNPIEQAFAKLKALLRKAAARTIDDLWAAIAEAIECFPPEECANFFANSGYEPN